MGTKGIKGSTGLPGARGPPGIKVAICNMCSVFDFFRD